jgi:hypothetical protein
MAEVKRASYSLDKDYQEKLKEIASKSRRSMTEELRLMINWRAQTIGIEPVEQIDPKFSASVPVMAMA